METSIGLECPKKISYWIDRHRYYELKHYCLQYVYWMRVCSVTPEVGGPNIQRYREGINLLRKIAKETDSRLGKYILKAVTEGLSYEALRTKTNISCCKTVYYEMYRRFFWLLSEARH